jgi:hypothetical protein
MLRPAGSASGLSGVEAEQDGGGVGQGRQALERVGQSGPRARRGDEEHRKIFPSRAARVVQHPGRHVAQVGLQAVRVALGREHHRRRRLREMCAESGLRRVVRAVEVEDGHGRRPERGEVRLEVRERRLGGAQGRAQPRVPRVGPHADENAQLGLRRGHGGVPGRIRARRASIHGHERVLGLRVDDDGVEGRRGNLHRPARAVELPGAGEQRERGEPRRHPGVHPHVALLSVRVRTLLWYRAMAIEYPRPSFTVDVVLIRYVGRLEILLIQRKKDPFEGQWALPGGLRRKGRAGPRRRRSGARRGDRRDLSPGAPARDRGLRRSGPRSARLDGVFGLDRPRAAGRHAGRGRGRRRRDGVAPRDRSARARLRPRRHRARGPCSPADAPAVRYGGVRAIEAGVPQRRRAQTLRPRFWARASARESSRPGCAGAAPSSAWGRRVSRPPRPLHPDWVR